MRTIDFRTYLTLEAALTQRLIKEWRQQSAPIYAAIALACTHKQWDKARQLVTDLDLTDTGRAHKEWIKYLLLSIAIYGAGMVSKGKPTFLATGTYDDTLNQVTETILQYLEYGATAQIQKQALQLIAEDEAKSKIQKQEHEFGNTQINIPDESEAAKALASARWWISEQDVMGAGIDDTNHITVRYGLEVGSLDNLRAFCAQLDPFWINLDGVMTFEPSEHSEGATPVVARVVSTTLHFIHKEIAKHGPFKEDTFPVYRPHVTLAYCKPEIATKYLDIPLQATYLVRDITISHQNGVVETIPFGITRKADASGRFVTPFVSFDKQGEGQLQLIASLNSSRLATWGFTAECEVRGIHRYRLSAVLDGRTSRYCREVADGREFDVSDARTKVVESLHVQDPNDLRTVQPWPKQSQAALDEFKQMSDAELVQRGLHIPPYHPRCRTVCHLIGTKVVVGKPQAIELPAQEEQQTITPETMKEVGLEVTQAQVDHWNAYVGQSPVQVLAKLSGKTPQEIMSGSLGKKSIQFLENGDISVSARGIMGEVKYSVGTVLDPFSGTYYLTEAELVGDVEASQKFYLRLLRNVAETGQQSSATSLVVSVSGNVVPYVKLGFLPDAAQWQAIRLAALDELENGALKSLYSSLDDDHRVLVQHLLQDQDEQVIRVLADLAPEFNGKPIGQWILEGVQGNFALDVTDPEVMEQLGGYLL